MEVRLLADCWGSIGSERVQLDIWAQGFLLIYLHFLHRVFSNKDSSENGVYHQNDNISQLLQKKSRGGDNAL